MIWARINYQTKDEKRSLEFRCKDQMEFMQKVIDNGITPQNFLTCLISRGKGFAPIPRERFNEWYYQLQGGE